ncbi:hypothetical protein HDU85_005251 [Gaertneriomyces sp. JEL0708]|nr:hypothetical protein HDU85_005251 [Gaertneriomyces sp. JEL0708]
MFRPAAAAAINNKKRKPEDMAMEEFQMAKRSSTSTRVIYTREQILSSNHLAMLAQLHHDQSVSAPVHIPQQQHLPSMAGPWYAPPPRCPPSEEMMEVDEKHARVTGICGV